MRLEHLCDIEFVFHEMQEWPAKFLLIRPYGGEEGAGYGEGTGTVTGPRPQGRMRRVNHPHRCSNGAMLPDTHGVVHSEDGATVMFSLQGRTFFDGDTGKQLLLALFEAKDDRYQWLNSALCVLEGLIDAERLVMRARVFAYQHELE